jgi:aromatic-L-amino-acid decarboxylase
MTPEEFRAAGHRLVDWIADYRARVAELPVMARTEPGDVKRQLPAAPPAEAEPFDAIVADLDRIIVPALSHWQHPRFFGYFPSNGLLASVLGDFVSTGLGMLGLSSEWSGVIQDTASTSTLLALISAREKTSSYGASRGGLQGESQPLVVYVSAHAHSSVDKAALLAGFGRQNVHVVPADTSHAMRADALDAMIERDLQAGATPCAVVATSGTTTSTAFDPVGALARVARKHQIWLHVDAAMAGSAMILSECRHLWQGIDQADSVVINPHKWLGAAFDCTVYYVRDAEHLVRVMSTNPSYLQSAADGRVKNLRDWGVPLGRRFRALKLWFLIREQGVAGLQARLRRDVANAQWLADRVRATPGWSVLAPVPLQTLCVRHQPAGLEGEPLDRHTLAWVDRVNRSGEAYLTPALLDGRWMVRVSIGAEGTERQHVEALWAVMQKEVRS